MRGFRGGIGGLGGFSAALAIAGQALGLLTPAMPQIPQSAARVGRRKARPTAYGGGRTKTTWHLPHGKRERERRMRQIARGQLRVENGLASDA
jgi:hypothetical protein